MEKVSVLSMICMTLSALMSFTVPVVLAVFLRKKYRADWLPFIAGYVVMFVFAFVLEAKAHAVILAGPAGRVIQGNVFLYGIYGGLMAALFEEGGRALAFGTVLRKKDRKVNALMYGAGHGGMEFMMVLGVTNINNLIYSGIVNTGGQDAVLAQMPAEQAAVASAAFAALAETPPGYFLLGLAERFMALALQLSFSCLVFLALQRGRRRFFFIAIFFHALADALAGILSGMQVSVMVIECMILVLTGIVVLTAWTQMREAEDRGQG